MEDCEILPVSEPMLDVLQEGYVEDFTGDKLSVKGKNSVVVQVLELDSGEEPEDTTAESVVHEQSPEPEDVAEIVDVDLPECSDGPPVLLSGPDAASEPQSPEIEVALRSEDVPEEISSAPEVATTNPEVAACDAPQSDASNIEPLTDSAPAEANPEVNTLSSEATVDLKDSTPSKEVVGLPEDASLQEPDESALMPLQHHAAWTAGIEGHETVTIHKANIIAPTISFAPPPHLLGVIKCPDTGVTRDKERQIQGGSGNVAPESGFILTGSIKLFGIDSLTADFYSHHGPPPAWVDPDEEPIYQMAVLKDDLRISSIVPEFSGAQFDFICLKDVSLVYQNMQIDPTKFSGITLSARINFDSSYGQVHDVLAQFFGFEQPSLNVSCNFGFASDWHEALKEPSFRLTGTFTDVKPKPACDKIQLTSVGGSLIGFTSTILDRKNGITRSMSYGYELFGTFHVTVPGSVVPLEMDFIVSEIGENVTLEGSLDGEWEHAFGISSLTLDHVALTVELDLKAPLDTLRFDLSATFEIGELLVSLNGHYSTDGDFSLTASFDELHLQGLVDIFAHFFDEEVDLPDVDVYIGGATITIDKAAGFALMIHDLRVGDYSAIGGVVTVGSAGITLKATVDGDVLKIDDVEIKNAFAEVVLSRKSSGTKTSVLLGGELEWEGHEFDVAVHLYQSPEPGKSSFEYTILGQFKTLKSGEPLPLTTLVPGLKDTFMEEVTLQQAALVVASRNDAELGALTHTQFPIKKGIQVCAVMGELSPLKSAMGDNHPASLILSAGWIQGEGFTFDILFPSPTTIHLGRGIITDPIELKIVLGGLPTLKIVGGAIIPVQNQKEPLHFMIEVALDELGAAATGQLSSIGGWKNPFGISEQLTVGPDLALKIAIIWETFLVTGPSGFGFVGGLEVGKVAGQMAFDIEEVPSRELLFTKIERLDVQDLVAFASTITSIEIAKPPNVIIFEELSIYICPAGTTIGTLVYPPGFSFVSKAIIFGIHADINVSVGSAGIKASGGIDNLTLGPLTIRGVHGPRAMFDLELTSSKQYGKIDGLIDFLGAEVSLVASFELHPNFTFDFLFKVDFADLFELEVHAAPVTVPTEDCSDVTTTDYKLTAEFHQKIRGFVATKINQLFDEKARQEAKEAEQAKEEIEEERQKWKENVDKKQAELDAAYAAWSSKSTDSHAEHDRIAAEEDAKTAERQQVLDDTSAKLRSDLADAQCKLTAANNDRASRVKADEEALSAKQAEWNTKITEAHQKVDETTSNMHSGFGDVERSIDDARQKVDSLQSDIDDFSRRINDCENADFWDVPAKAQIPVLECERAGVYIAKEVADGILTAARAVIEAEDYLACKGFMEAASLALDAAQEAADLAIKAAEAALQVTNDIVNGLVAVAEKVLEEASKLGQVAVDLASKALDEVKEASIAIRASAQSMLDGLKSCGEWLAYEAASAVLTVAKAAGSGAMLVAEAGVVIADKVSEVAMRAWQFVLSGLVSFVDITDVVITAELGKAVGGFAFSASVRGTIGGDQFFGFEVEFDTKEVVKFIKAVFDKLVDLVEDGILEGGKAFIDALSS